MNHDPSLADSEPPAFWRSRYAVGLLVMGAIAAYFLLSEHRAHLLGALPFLLLLACPLMHVFMHHGQGGQRGAQVHHHHAPQAPAPSTSSTPPAASPTTQSADLS